MEERVERARPQPISMPAQLLDQGEAVDRRLGRMVEHVDLDEPKEELARQAIVSQYHMMIWSTRAAPCRWPGSRPALWAGSYPLVALPQAEAGIGRVSLMAAIRTPADANMAPATPK